MPACSTGTSLPTWPWAPTATSMCMWPAAASRVNGERLDEGDGARIRNAGDLHFAKGEDAEVLVFDLRPNELPTMPH